MSSVVGRNIVDLRDTLPVTIRWDRIRRIQLVGRSAARAPIQRIARIAFERRRQIRTQQASAGDGALAVALPECVRRLDRSAPPGFRLGLVRGSRAP